MNSLFSSEQQNTLRPLITVVIVGGLFYVAGQYIASQPQRIQQEVEANREITVQGTGEVQARPDIAQVTLSVQTGPQPTAEQAMELLTTKFTNVLNGVKEIGIEEKDIQTTNLSLNPSYDYRDGQQTLRGYEASETIHVKVRDLTKTSSVLGRTTAEGVNQVGGISFTIDEPEELQEQAQKKAIDDAAQNAETLAKNLGVSLGRVKTFSSSETPKTPPMPFIERSLSADGRGGAEVPVEAGEQTITSNVTITYEIR